MNGSARLRGVVGSGITVVIDAVADLDGARVHAGVAVVTVAGASRVAVGIQASLTGSERAPESMEEEPVCELDNPPQSSIALPVQTAV